MFQEALDADLARLVAEARADELPALIGRLEAAKAAAWARLTAPAAVAPVDEEENVNLSAAETARRLGLSKEWLYRNADRLPFAVRIGRRVLFAARGLERWQRGRASGRS